MQVTSGRAAVADENNLTAGEAAAELLLRVVRRNILYSSRAQSMGEPLRHGLSMLVEMMIIAVGIPSQMGLCVL